VRLLVGVVDTYFDANAVEAIDEEGVSGLLEEVNVRLLARLRRLTCQVVVNACSSSFTWRQAIGTLPILFAGWHARTQLTPLFISLSLSLSFSSGCVVSVSVYVLGADGVYWPHARSPL